MKDKWINEIKERMENYTPEAPEGLLQDVQEEMRRRGLSPVPVAQHRRMVPWIRTVSAAAALLVLLFGTALYLNRPIEQNSLAIETRQAVSALDSLREADNGGSVEESLLAMNRETVNEKRLSSVQLVDRVDASVREGKEPEESVEKVAEPIQEGAAVEKTEFLQESAAAAKDENTERSYTEKNGMERAVQNETWQVERKKHSRISAGVFYSGGLVEQSQTGRGLMLTAANPYGTFHQELSGEQVNGFLNETQDHETKVHHAQPVKLGLSVNIPLDNRWSLQTGITYSFLSSDITRTQQSLSQVAKQRLYYVGIPVRASYQLWQHKDWKVYTAAGGEVERMVAGREKDKVTVAGEVKSTSSRKLKESKLQFSANIMAGVEYQWNQHLGVYAEAGAAYYFDNGSVLETIYSEKPLNINLSVGLRIHL